jgi:hypothetical protein
VRAALGGLNSSAPAAEGAVRAASSSASSAYPRVSRSHPLPAVEFAKARLAPLEVRGLFCVFCRCALGGV